MQPSTLGWRCHERWRLSRRSSRPTLKAYFRDHTDRVCDYQDAIFSRAQTDYDSRSRNATRSHGDREVDQTACHNGRLDEKATVKWLQTIQRWTEAIAGKEHPFSQRPSGNTLHNLANRNLPRAYSNSPLARQVAIFREKRSFPSQQINSPPRA